MKPRSSSAEISRWTPLFDLRSSASFISSNEGETPVSRELGVDVEKQLMLLARQHAKFLPWNVCGTCTERYGSCQAAAAPAALASCQEIGEQDVAMLAGDALGMELDAVDRQRRVAQALDRAVLGAWH